MLRLQFHFVYAYFGIDMNLDWRGTFSTGNFLSENRRRTPGERRRFVY